MLKRMFYSILFVMVVMTVIPLGLYIYSFYETNNEEKQYQHLEEIADTYNEYRFVVPMIRGMKDLYSKNHNDTIGIYKTEDTIYAYSYKQFKKNGKKIIAGHTIVNEGDSFIMFKEGQHYIIYRDVYSDGVHFDDFHLTFEDDILKAKVKKTVGLDNMDEIASNFRAIKKEIRANEKNNKAPASIRTINQTMNLMQYGDIDGPKKIAEKEPSPWMGVFNALGSIIKFFVDYWKWIFVIIILSAIASAVSAAAGSGYSNSSDEWEENEPNKEKKSYPEEKKDKEKTTTRPSEDNKEQKKNVKEPVNETTGPKNNSRVGMVNLHIEDISNWTDRDRPILFKNGRYFINTGFGNSDLWADSSDEIKVKAISYFSKWDGVKKVNVEVYE